MTYCDQDTEGGGWTTILNRDASKDHEDFDRDYSEYEEGFGDRNGEFWLGLESIHQLTSFPCNELMVEMEMYNSSRFVARYSTFKVGSQAEGYVLTISGFYSTPEFPDDFAYQNGMKFTTKDNDQDELSFDNCAIIRNGGWWHKNCFSVKLTGDHFEEKHETGEGIHWINIFGYSFVYSLKKASMKVRRC